MHHQASLKRLKRRRLVKNCLLPSYLIPFEMNCKEHHLPELELATGQAREALQAILYTILLYVPR